MQIDDHVFQPGMQRQLQALQQALAAGMPRRGWKIGFNSLDVQALFELPHAAVGWLDGGKILASGGSYQAAADADIRLEPEIGLLIDKTADGTCSIKAVCPVIELVNYNRPGADFDAILAHSMFHEATVVGEMQALNCAEQLGQRWPILELQDAPKVLPQAELVPSDLEQVVHFTSQYLPKFGAALEQGDLIIAGTYTSPMAIQQGQTAVADFGPLGRISISLA